MSGRDEWKAAFEAAPKRDVDGETMSGVPVNPVYGPDAGSVPERRGGSAPERSGGPPPEPSGRPLPGPMPPTPGRRWSPSRAHICRTHIVAVLATPADPHAGLPR